MASETATGNRRSLLINFLRALTADAQPKWLRRTSEKKIEEDRDLLARRVESIRFDYEILNETEMDYIKDAYDELMPKIISLNAGISWKLGKCKSHHERDGNLL